MLRYFFALCILGGCAVVAIAGFRGSKMTQPPLEIFPDMDHQPKFQPQHPSGFFADGRAARKPVEGTIPIGYNLDGRFLQAGARNAAFGAGFSNAPDYYNTGKIGDSYGEGIPTEITEQLLDRGEERFNINCAVCHGRGGGGNGIVTQFGFAPPPINLHDERIRIMPDGQLFSTITNGKNTMGAYGPVIAVDDRWAIVTYVRALQRSANAKVSELTEAQQKALPQEKK